MNANINFVSFLFRPEFEHFSWINVAVTWLLQEKSRNRESRLKNSDAAEENQV